MSINLPNTSTSLQMISGAALLVNVVASYVDVTTSGSTPGSQTSNPSTAVTTTIVSAPAASTQRCINDVEIVAVGAGTQTITIQVNTGSTFIIYGPIALAQNERLHYTADRGWRKFGVTGGETGPSGPVLSHWNNYSPEPQGVIGMTTGSLWLFPLPYDQVFPGNMTIGTLRMGMSFSGTIVSASMGTTLRVGLYTLNNSSQLSLLNSGSAAFTNTSNASVVSLWNGPRFMTMHSSQWSTQPVLTQGHYWLGVCVSAAAASYSASYRAASVGNTTYSGVVGVATGGQVVRGMYPFHGALSTVNIPASIAATAITQSNLYGNLIPHVQLLSNIAVS